MLPELGSGLSPVGFNDATERSGESAGCESGQDVNAHLGFLMQQVKERNERALKELSANEGEDADERENHDPMAATASDNTAVANTASPPDTPSQGQADDFDGFRAYQDFLQYREFLQHQDEPAFQAEFRRFFDWWRSDDVDRVPAATGGEGRRLYHDFDQNPARDEPVTATATTLTATTAAGKTRPLPQARFIPSKHHKFSFYPSDPLVYHGRSVRELDEFVCSCEREFRLCPMYFPTDQAKVLWAVRRLAKKPAGVWHASLGLGEYGGVKADGFGNQLERRPDLYSWGRFKRVLLADLGEKEVVGGGDWAESNSVADDLFHPAAASSREMIVGEAGEVDGGDGEGRSVRHSDFAEFRGYEGSSAREQSARPAELDPTRPMAGEELIQMIMDSVVDSAGGDNNGGDDVGSRSQAGGPDSPDRLRQLEQARRELDLRLNTGGRGSDDRRDGEEDDILDDYVSPRYAELSADALSKVVSIDRTMSGRIEHGRRYATRARGYRARGRAGRAGRGPGRGGRAGYRGQ